MKDQILRTNMQESPLPPPSPSLTQEEKKEAAIKIYNEVMNLGSRQVVTRFLTDRANAFLHQNCAKSKDGQPLIPRKARRKAARELAKRLTKQARSI